MATLVAVVVVAAATTIVVVVVVVVVVVLAPQELGTYLTKSAEVILEVGRGIARIDYDTMDSLAVSTGDVVEIRGKRRTTAKCLPLYPSDEGKGIIRIDGLVRNNSGIAIGDTIFIREIVSSSC